MNGQTRKFERESPLLLSFLTFGRIADLDAVNSERFSPLSSLALNFQPYRLASEDNKVNRHILSVTRRLASGAAVCEVCSEHTEKQHMKTNLAQRLYIFLYSINSFR